MGELTWPQAQDLLAYWKANPPTHILLKGFLAPDAGGGSKPRAAEGEDGGEWTPQQMDEFMAMFGGSGGQVVQVTEG